MDLLQIGPMRLLLSAGPYATVEKKPCAWHGSLLIAEGYAAWYCVARLRTISNTPWQASSR